MRIESVCSEMQDIKLQAGKLRSINITWKSYSGDQAYNEYFLSISSIYHRYLNMRNAKQCAKGLGN